MKTVLGRSLEYDVLIVQQNCVAACPQVGEVYEGKTVVGIEIARSGTITKYYIYVVYPENFNPYNN